MATVKDSLPLALSTFVIAEERPRRKTDVWGTRQEEKSMASVERSLRLALSTTSSLLADTVCRALLLACIVFFVTCAPMIASPTQYSITFTDGMNCGLVQCTLPTAAGFDYDSVVQTFTNFVVTWDGLSFDMTSDANNPIVVGLSQTCGYTGAQLAFQLLDRNPCILGLEPFIGWSGASLTNGNVIFFRFLLADTTATTGLVVETTLSQVASNDAVGNGEWVITPSTSTVPEPTSIVLLGTGLVAAWRSRRKPC